MASAVGRTDPFQMWCGRSWQGLEDRRTAMFEQASALRGATSADVASIVPIFLGFLDETGLDLMRDEEEWIFCSLRPTPSAVLAALDDHIEIATFIQALAREASAGSADLRVVHQLGALIEDHLLMEEEEVRPLATPAGPPHVLLRAR